MRYKIALPLLACVAGCSNPTPTQLAQVQQVVNVVCNVDSVLVPIAQPVVATFGTSGAAVVSIDQLMVHPSVVAACQQLGGVPTQVTPVGAPVAVPAGG
jgi:hypothetical protein